MQTRATKTVEAIVEAAARILETLGFEGYTTNAIAERAGVSIGSLYQYFPNKDAVTLALIDRESATLLQDVLEGAAVEDWREALDRMVDAAVRHQLRRPSLARLLDLEEARLSAADETASGADGIYAAIRSVLARAGLGESGVANSTVADVIGITRGITDMAGRARETDAENLQRRVRRAVFGYLLSNSDTERRAE